MDVLLFTMFWGTSNERCGSIYSTVALWLFQSFAALTALRTLQTIDLLFVRVFAPISKKDIEFSLCNSRPGSCSTLEVFCGKKACLLCDWQVLRVFTLCGEMTFATQLEAASKNAGVFAALRLGVFRGSGLCKSFHVFFK